MPFANTSLKAWKNLALWLGGFAIFALIIILNLDFTTFLRYLLLGLPQGAIIALIAVGYSMVYGIIQLINFAHGEVFMFSTYFIVMLMAPAASNQMTGLLVVSGCIGILVACTMWVLFSRIPNGVLRLIISVALGSAFAVVNHLLIPRAGGTVIVPLVVAYALALFYSCCLGVTMDLVAYRPLRSSPRLIPLITAIGISLFLANFAQSIWGSQAKNLPLAATPSLFVGEEARVKLSSNLDVSKLDITIVLLAVFLMIALQLFIHKTKTGKVMRACAQDRVTASLMGIRVDNVVAFTFALGAGLAAIVSPLYVMRGSLISPSMGYIVGILAFASAVLGGIGNVTGAMLGGMIIGIIYSFVPLFDALDRFKWFQWAESAGWITSEGYYNFITAFGRPGNYQLGVAYFFMILVIVFKPTGLLGRASAKRA